MPLKIYKIYKINNLNNRRNNRATILTWTAKEANLSLILLAQMSLLFCFLGLLTSFFFFNAIKFLNS